MPHVPRERPSLGAEAGYVYLIHMDGVYKIGKTKSWHSRSRAYRGHPHPVTLVALLRSFDAAKLESSLHARYASKRLNGEWFRLTPTDVEEIKSHPLRVDQEI